MVGGVFSIYIPRSFSPPFLPTYISTPPQTLTPSTIVNFNLHSHLFTQTKQPTTRKHFK
ncbi:hypothetical protein QC761_0055290 [Podospora bellae-mahoneyi]|uniref:Uncharacterized protein n=1 Tax=Podospora bellae-mahoneyi TaxID=2093777 RepID=A0ABR0FL71_9PEZI|nr:hypothetical protein QC761_0055290 [Podospora bellae-mahoneyi]